MKKQLDEMEKNIKLHAQATGFKVFRLFLAVWTLYESYIALTTGRRLNIIPCLILTVCCTISGIYELILKRKMINGDEEYKEPNKVVITIVSIFVAAAIIISIGSFVLISIH